MTDYVTAAEILSRVDLYELHQRTTRHLPLVTEASLNDAILGNDMSGYSADVQTETASALARINTRITDATNIINSMLGGSYTLPMLLTYDSIKPHCTSIAVFMLYGDVFNEGDPVKILYDMAMDWLSKVASGQLTLGLDTTEAEVGKPNARPTTLGLV